MCVMRNVPARHWRAMLEGPAYEEEDACVSYGMCLLDIGAQCWKGLRTST
jgi:hypothetical protein